MSGMVVSSMKLLNDSSLAQYGSRPHPKHPSSGRKISYQATELERHTKPWSTLYGRGRNGPLAWRTALTQHPHIEPSMCVGTGQLRELTQVIWRSTQAMGNHAQIIPKASFMIEGLRQRTMEKGLGLEKGLSSKLSTVPSFLDDAPLTRPGCGAHPLFTESLLYNPLKGGL